MNPTGLLGLLQRVKRDKAAADAAAQAAALADQRAASASQAMSAAALVMQAQANTIATLRETIDGQATTINALKATTALVLPGQFLIDELPNPAANLGSYAVVTDLWGDGTLDKLLAARSIMNGQATSYWMPLRPVHGQRQTISANAVLNPLKNVQVQLLTGGATAARQVTLGTAKVWPGAMFEISFNGSLGLFGLNIAGLAVGGLLAMLSGANARFVYDDGWRKI